MEQHKQNEKELINDATILACIESALVIDKNDHPFSTWLQQPKYIRVQPKYIRVPNITMDDVYLVYGIIKYKLYDAICNIRNKSNGMYASVVITNWGRTIENPVVLSLFNCDYGLPLDEYIFDGLLFCSDERRYLTDKQIIFDSKENFLSFLFFQLSNHD
jgi:hypothetical protein